MSISKQLCLYLILSSCLISSCSLPINATNPPFVESYTPPLHIPEQEQCSSTNNKALQNISHAAREYLQKIPVHEHSCIKHAGKKTITIPGREIVLAVCSSNTHEITAVHIKICYETPENLEVATPGYQVRWKGGKGITRFTFDVSKSDTGEQLLLLDSKHWMQESGGPAYYFPYSDDMLTTDVVSAGITTLNEIIDTAFLRLHEKKVYSRAFPNKLLGDIFSHDIFYNLALIEQIDDDEFLRECPSLTTLPQKNRIFTNCPEYAAYKVLVHYARNGNDAFRYVSSSAGAGGAMQFMPKTYMHIQRQYSSAKLHPSFKDGVADAINATIAAICLLDLNLSIIDGVADEFIQNPRMGSLYLMAAYNGGPARAKRLYRALGKRKKCCEHVAEVPPMNREVARETNGYLIKYVGLWDILDNLAPRIQKKSSE